MAEFFQNIGLSLKMLFKYFSVHYIVFRQYAVFNLKFISSSDTIRGKLNFNKYNKRLNIIFKEKLVTRFLSVTSAGLLQVKTTHKAQRI